MWQLCDNLRQGLNSFSVGALMPFLSIVFTYLLARYTALGRWLHHDRWLLTLIDRLAAVWPTSSLVFFAVPVACSLLVLVALWKLPFWIAFFLGVALLLFSVGRGDWHSCLEDLAIQLRDGNAEAVWLRFEQEGVLSGDGGDPGQNLWLAWRRYAGCWYLNRLFAVFFWFFFFGPAGAVFYRMCSIYNRHPAVVAGNLPSYQKWQWLLEWLPVRYMALCSCLAGNFTTGFQVLQRVFLDNRLSSADVLAQCLESSMIQENVTEVPANVDETLRLTLMRSSQLDALLVRTEMIGLVGLALIILIAG